MTATQRSLATLRPGNYCNTRTVITSTSSKQIRTCQNGISSAVLQANVGTMPASHRHLCLPGDPIEVEVEAHRPQNAGAHHRAARTLTVGNWNLQSATCPLGEVTEYMSPRTCRLNRRTPRVTYGIRPLGGYRKLSGRRRPNPDSGNSSA